ncbi:hypothetical protein KY285_035650 [Solanum tuberosum]|nr:hypothetical protein KY285_035650 [Solanum tuberosum]
MSLKVLTKSTTKPMKCNLEWNSEYGFEVKDNWAVLHFRKLEPINYVAHWYSKETYLKIHSHYVQPVTNMEMWPHSTNHYVIPHVIRTLPGRPGKCRRKSRMKTKQENCPREGHNKRGCHLNSQANVGIGRGRGRGREISSTRSSVGSFTTPTESQSRQREEEVDQEASATGRRRGTTTSNGTSIGVAADGSGATGRGKGIGTDLAERGRGTATGLAGRGKGTGVARRERGTGVVATATNVPDAIGGGKRPRMVGMGYYIHRVPGMPMNSSIMTGNLGHHKSRSGLK